MQPGYVSGLTQYPEITLKLFHDPRARRPRTHGLCHWQALCTSNPGDQNFGNCGRFTICYGDRKFSSKVVAVKSDHILTRRLYNAVTENAVLEQAETEHLQLCDECLELVRLFVRQNLQKAKRKNQ